jgi:uncharacterized protein YeaO (DUF488 family)
VWNGKNWAQFQGVTLNWNRAAIQKYRSHCAQYWTQFRTQYLAEFQKMTHDHGTQMSGKLTGIHVALEMTQVKYREKVRRTKIAAKIVG